MESVMYAVVETGGKQYRIEEGQTIKIEKLPQDVDASVDFEKILMVVDGENVKIGTPHVEGAKVTGTILEQGRLKKIKIVKFKRRKHHLKQMGHRQYFTAVNIDKISA
jgi:large subunit ribosomal protein L21